MKWLATVLALCALASSALGSPDSVTLQVSASTSAVPASVTVSIRDQVIQVAIPPHAPASTKRDLIRAALAGAGYTVVDDGPLGSSLTILGLARRDTVQFHTQASGEVLDTLRHSTCGHSSVRFVSAGPFGPFDSNLQPAVFTAGIVTDVGVLTEQVSAQELNFQTDGPIICQALFQRLAPRAPQYGAQIQYAGDRLEVYFDPAYTVTQGGIVFGTSSPTPGCSGEVENARVERALELRVSDSTNEGPAPMRLRIADLDAPELSEVLVQPHMPAPLLRSLVLDGLLAEGVAAFRQLDSATTTIVGLSRWSIVTAEPGSTGQAEVGMSGPEAGGGRVRFTGFFLPFDTGGQHAIFTAGIVTDVGELREQVSAAELVFQTDGPIICQALFQRLAPRAPQYGARLYFAGDRLEVYFDPAYTVTQGGVIFGTTSPSEGCTGSLLFPDKMRRR